MVKRFLVTTALEETWGHNEPILFLGEWCKRYSRRDSWLNLNTEVLPYHWDDREKMYDDYKYLQLFYEKLLLELCSKLNEVHNVKCSLRYWRILIGPWLGYFVQVVFDRWESIQKAVHEHDISGTIISECESSNYVPNDMNEFSEFISEDEWNHYIYSEIIQNYTTVSKKNILIQNSTFKNSDVVLNKKKTKNISIKSTVRKLYLTVMRLFVRNDDAFFLSTYLPLYDEFKLGLRMRQAPIKWTSIPAVKTCFNKNKRTWNLNVIDSSDFEKCIRYMIPRQMPKVYLEGYKKLVEQVNSSPWPTKPKLIWTSNACNSDDVFKAWAADKMDCGAPLVIGQHGGHYGVGKWSFNESHEMTICNRYLSWGWGKGIAKVKAVGQLKAKHPLNIKHSDKSKLLLVTAVVPRYSYWMYSIMVSRQFLDYFDDQCAFIDNLPVSIQESLIVRLYPNDYGWDQEKRWNDRFPNQCIDTGQNNIQALINQSRIYISTYNATTFLESFTMNVPTVIYWNPLNWELRTSAIPYFEELKNVGIFHESAESAAKHVANIWEDVDSWWNSDSVTRVVNRFCEQYADLPKDYLTQVEMALCEVIDSYKTKNVSHSNST